MSQLPIELYEKNFSFLSDTKRMEISDLFVKCSNNPNRY